MNTTQLPTNSTDTVLTSTPHPLPPYNKQPRSHSQPTTQLTKRELLVAMAVQDSLTRLSIDGVSDHKEKLAIAAIEYADALLKELGNG